MGASEAPKLREPGQACLTGYPTFELCALLAGEPWRMDRERVLKQERWWVLNVLCYPREEGGGLKPLPASGRQAVRQSGETMFVAWWTGLGMAEHRARALWAMQLKQAQAEQAERDRRAGLNNGR